MHDDPARDPLDDLIDQTARSMTAGAPSAGLRDAVRSRVTGRNRRAARWFSVPAWQGALAAAVMVVVAALLGPTMWRDGVSRDAREPVPSAQPTTPPPTPAAPAVSGEPAASVASAEGRPAAEPVSASARARAPQPIVIEPLNLDPLEAPRMSVEAIQDSMPIVVDPLRVVPLSME